MCHPTLKRQTIDCDRCWRQIVLYPDPDNAGEFLGDYGITPTQQIVCATCATELGLPING